jgi:hypothetical protein
MVPQVALLPPTGIPIITEGGGISRDWTSEEAGKLRGNHAIAWGGPLEITEP